MWYARLPAYGNTKVKYAPVPKPREVALNSRYGLGTCVLDATYSRQKGTFTFWTIILLLWPWVMPSRPSPFSGAALPLNDSTTHFIFVQPVYLVP